MDIIRLDKLTTIFYSLDDSNSALYLYTIEKFSIETGLVSWKSIEKENFMGFLKILIPSCR